LIYTAEELKLIGKLFCIGDKHFKLMADLNMIDFTFATAVIAPDTPDTSYQFKGTPFTGVFDGAGHVIHNLTIGTAETLNDYLGLFGQIDTGGEVKNLGLENVSITGGNGSWYLGGLCGGNIDGTISNCYATGSVTGGDESGAVRV
jgi:hypothetical protein